MSEPPSPSIGPDDPRLRPLIERFISLCDAGTVPDVAAFLAAQPDELRDALRVQIEALQAVRRVLRGPEPSAQVDPDLVGKKLGEFELERELGRGGMGVVYLAWQPSLRRRVALKVLPPSLAASSRRMERFLREAMSEGRLNHPNIVRVLESGQEGETPYFAMEWLKGGSLHQRLEERRRQRDARTDRLGSDIAPIHVQEIVTALAEIADALAHSHVNGVIHRDVKPHNILFDDRGAASLADFGLAKDLELESLSRTGELCGTPHYLSPEQAFAKRVRVDHRTDIYSLGVVLYESLSLRRPFDGETNEKILLAITLGDPIPLRRLEPRVPRDLETICHRAIQKLPEKRFTDAAEFAAELRRFLQHEAILSRPPTPLERLQRWSWRHRVPLSAGVLVVCGAGAGAATHSRLAAGDAAAHVLDVARTATAADLATLDLPHLLTAVQQVRAAMDLRQELSRDAAGELETMRQRADAACRIQKAAFLTQMRRGLHQPLAGAAPLDYAPQDDTSYFEALRDLAPMLELLPDDPEIRRFRQIDETWPHFTLVAGAGCEAAVQGATVAVRPIDPIRGTLGPERPLGPMPITRHPIPPGCWRILIRKEGVGFSELTRWYDQRGRDQVETVWLRPTAEASAGLLPVPEGRFRFGSRDRDAGVFAERDVELPAFRIARCEASNREYLAFLDQTGRSPPPDWPERPPSDRLDLPVIWITYDEAQAFAEWRGCRLPTVFEWEKAARGTDGRTLPWLDETAVPLAERANVGAEYPDMVAGVPDHVTLWRWYLATAWPVAKEIAGAASPFGLLHVVGNASEWTESMEVIDDQGLPTPSVHQRLVKGASFTTDRFKGRFLRLAATDDPFVSVRVLHFGVRIARSEEP